MKKAGDEGSGLRRFEIVWVLLIIIAFYGALFLLGITCPIRFITGISCPGCGMVRAWLSLLRGNPAAAMDFHPLFWTMIPAAVLWLFRRRLPVRAARGIIWGYIALFILVYLIRMFMPGQDIVVFDPASGLMGRAATHFLR